MKIFRLPCARLFGFEPHYHLDEANANKNFYFKLLSPLRN